MSSIVRKALADESGATAIEYALLASLIFMVIVTAVTSVGQEVAIAFDNAGEGFKKSN